MNDPLSGYCSQLVRRKILNEQISCLKGCYFLSGGTCGQFSHEETRQSQLKHKIKAAFADSFL